MASRLSQPEFFQKPYSSTPLPAATCFCCFKVQPGLIAQLVGNASHLGVCCLPSTSLHSLGRRRITTVFICTPRRELPTSDGFGVSSSILLHPGKARAFTVAYGVCFPQGSGKEEWWAQGRSSNHTATAGHSAQRQGAGVKECESRSGLPDSQASFKPIGLP